MQADGLTVSALLFALLTVGCISSGRPPVPGDRLAQVERGMKKFEVFDLLGEPKDTGAGLGEPGIWSWSGRPDGTLYWIYEDGVVIFEVARSGTYVVKVGVYE